MLYTYFDEDTKEYETSLELRCEITKKTLVDMMIEVKHNNKEIALRKLAFNIKIAKDYLEEVEKQIRKEQTKLIIEEV